MWSTDDRGPSDLGVAGRESLAVPPRLRQPGARLAKAGDVKGQVFAAIANAARAGFRAPGIQWLADASECSPRQIRRALERLERDGCLVRIGSAHRRRYVLPTLGLETAAGPPRSVDGWAWEDDSLTPSQRRIVVVALDLLAAGRVVSAAEIARTLDLPQPSTHLELIRITQKGYLSCNPRGLFVLAKVKASTAPRVEYRDGVRVTIYPAMFAEGALRFRMRPRNQLVSDLP